MRSGQVAISATSSGVVSGAPGFVAIVLHAHLPYVRHPEHARSIEERWLYEALWECYLPLLGALGRLANDGMRGLLTLSISPPLASMLRDDLLCRRFEDHLERTAALVNRLLERSPSPFEAALRAHRDRLAEARELWDRAGGDVLTAFVRHASEGTIELLTTAASHAYLPGLAPASPASVRAQIRLGLRSFEALTGVRPTGLWLPECAFEPGLDRDLAGAGALFTILDGHGIELARPRPPRGLFAPILSPRGVAYAGRDPNASRDVWSRASGYPGDPAYREFYRDVGFDLPESDLAGEIGPGGARLMTGVKLHRVTGKGPDKAPYDPDQALARAEIHAAHFVEERSLELRSAARERGVESSIELPPPLAVAPFDAELFGHWWFEGPLFLERALRLLAASAREGGVAPISLGAYLSRFPEAFVAEPAASTWGEGGFGAAWAGAASARLWRHVHHAAREVEAAVLRRRSAVGVAGAALDQAIRELLLLEASDWAFMLTRGEMAPYAEERVRSHASRARRLAAIAMSDEVSREAAVFTRAVAAQDRFCSELAGDRIRDAFDPWPAGAP
jgi:1,4-alpha-glucan branching enzyme